MHMSKSHNLAVVKKAKVVTSLAELDATLAAGEGNGQYIVRLYEDHTVPTDSN